MALDMYQGTEGDDAPSNLGHLHMYGLDGNDTLRSDRAGFVKIYGGEDNDTIEYLGTAGNLTGYGGDGNDTVTGGPLADRLYGDEGRDILSGNGGNDILSGGLGRDFFLFGAEFRTGPKNVETILDFSVPLDTILLFTGVFGLGPTDTTLASAKFHKGGGAHDPSDRIIYNPATGGLFFDGNGTGAGRLFKIGQLDAHLNMTHLDFVNI